MISLDRSCRFGSSWTKILVIMLVLLTSHALLAKNPELDNGQLNTGDPVGGGRRPDEVCAGGGWEWAGGQPAEESVEVICVPYCPLILLVNDHCTGGRRHLPTFPFLLGTEESWKLPYRIVGEAGG